MNLQIFSACKVVKGSTPRTRSSVHTDVHKILSHDWVCGLVIRFIGFLTCVYTLQITTIQRLVLSITVFTALLSLPTVNNPLLPGSHPSRLAAISHHRFSTDRTENDYSIIVCSLTAGDTTCPQICSLAMAIVLSPVYTAVTWQWNYMWQYVLYFELLIFITMTHYGTKTKMMTYI
jgi:hypothetical protein